MDGQTPTQIGREGLTQKHRHTHTQVLRQKVCRCFDGFMDEFGHKTEGLVKTDRHIEKRKGHPYLPKL